MAEIDLRNNEQIPNGLPGEAMRKSMENKNILAEKGSLYVGTGAVETVEILGDNYLIAQTGKLTPGSDNAVLVTDSTSSVGLSYKNVNSLISGVVRYDASQSLSGNNQAQARANIKAAREFNVGPGLGLTTSSPDNNIVYLKAASEAELGGIKVSVVQSLPTTLVDDVFYFVTT